MFRLTSSSTDSEDKTNVATSAEADYVARGLQETIRNVHEANITSALVVPYGH